MYCLATSTSTEASERPYLRANLGGGGGVWGLGLGLIDTHAVTVLWLYDLIFITLSMGLDYLHV